MTCGLAVKRPHDYEAYLNSEAGVEIKRSRTASSHCSPFRPQLGTLAASLMQSTSSSSFPQNATNEDENSPFTNVSNKCNLSGKQLESYLRAEVQYLKRRKLIPSKTSKLAKSEDAPGPSTNYRRSAASPSSCHSGSDSDGEAGSSMGQRNAGGKWDVSELYEKPQFSLRQVKMICERLLKEQEIRLRYEYECALSKKLEEQHEQYVQFAKEQQVEPSTDIDYFYLS